MDHLWAYAGFFWIHKIAVVIICAVLGIICAALFYKWFLSDEDDPDIVGYQYNHKERDTFLAWLVSTVIFCLIVFLIAFIWIVVPAIVVVSIIRLAFPLLFESEVRQRRTHSL